MNTVITMSNAIKSCPLVLLLLAGGTGPARADGIDPASLERVVAATRQEQQARLPRGETLRDFYVRATIRFHDAECVTPDHLGLYGVTPEAGWTILETGDSVSAHNLSTGGTFSAGYGCADGVSGTAAVEAVFKDRNGFEVPVGVGDVAFTGIFQAGLAEEAVRSRLRRAFGLFDGR